MEIKKDLSRVEVSMDELLNKDKDWFIKEYEKLEGIRKNLIKNELCEE